MHPYDRHCCYLSFPPFCPRFLLSATIYLHPVKHGDTLNSCFLLTLLSYPISGLLRCCSAVDQTIVYSEKRDSSFLPEGRQRAANTGEEDDSLAGDSECGLIVVMDHHFHCCRTSSGIQYIKSVGNDEAEGGKRGRARARRRAYLLCTIKVQVV